MLAGDGPSTGSSRVAGDYLRAAQYLRMSTERQDYSIRNQAEALQQYAAANDMLIVRTYADEGRSGLTIEGRAALSQLIRDVEGGLADFDVLLIYDVSRWGRFQDADEGAYYEYLCRRAGIRVIYCAEVFRDDGSAMATVVKAIKRVMAGEYSRELSAKIFAGQANLARRGYKQGGPATLGLRRMVVDKDGQQKRVLAKGETKAFQNDRVILVPGPPEEVAIVRHIFEQFVAGVPLKHIAEELQAKGVPRLCGGQWRGDSVRRLLQNEAYIGNCVYNRASFKLQRELVHNPRSEWIRAEAVYEPIVSSELFWKVQKRLALSRAAWGSFRSRSHAQILGDLREVLDQQGELTIKTIEAAGLNPEFYRRRIGGVPRLRRLMGVSPPSDIRYELRPGLTEKRRQLIGALREGFERAGRNVQPGLRGELVVGQALTIWGRVTPCRVSARGLRTAFVGFPAEVSDLVVVECVTWESHEHLRYLVFDGAKAGGTKLQMGREASYRPHHLDDLAELWSLETQRDVRRLCHRLWRRRLAQNDRQPTVAGA